MAHLRKLLKWLSVGAGLREKEAAHRELQRELTMLSTQGRQIIASESGHGIQSDQPELLVESVEELIQRVRDERE
ncbi:MAG: hypothetical protein ACE5GX_15970 [Thermoanaerobaculia bacterium]